VAGKMLPSKGGSGIVGSVKTPIYRVSVAMPMVKKNEYIYKTKLFKKFYMYNFIHQKKSGPSVSSYKSVPVPTISSGIPTMVVHCITSGVEYKVSTLSTYIKFL
jgi:hypothetical protein